MVQVSSKFELSSLNYSLNFVVFYLVGFDQTLNLTTNRNFKGVMWYDTTLQKSFAAAWFPALQNFVHTASLSRLAVCLEFADLAQCTNTVVHRLKKVQMLLFRLNWYTSINNTDCKTSFFLVCMAKNHFLKKYSTSKSLWKKV